MVKPKKNFSYQDNGHIDIPAWIEKIKSTYHLTKIDVIEHAALFTEATGKGLTTFYGQPCIEQGLEMAEILLDLKLDPHAIAAAIIMSIMQHGNIKQETLKEKFGDDIAKLILSSLQMSVIHNLQSDQSRDQTQVDRLRKIFLAMASDIRVVLIKLAERTCIMHGIKNLNPIERKRLAQETMDIYAPLANRLGIGQLKWELEDLAFHYSDPDSYKLIVNFLAERRIDRENRIQSIMKRLKDALAEANIVADISGRAKHIYSIYLKMKRKHLELKDIYDYSAVRVLVPKIEDCYTALSIVNQLWNHIPEEFDDYIANPKSNGYRSIHTAVIDPDGKHFEIQIRSKDMHEEAEHGVAAHWIYKENKPVQTGYEAKIGLLRQLLAWHRDVAKNEDEPNQAYEKILEDRVYVFTPAGEILDLPIGATPLDFAYQIHSEIGHRCRGAKIHGSIVPLTYQLKTGDQIEIITTQHPAPSRDWLSKDSGYLHTSRARAKVAHWFKQQDLNQHIENGKHILERDIPRATLHQLNLQHLATRFNFKDEEMLLAAIGRGNIRASQILHASEVGQEKKPTGHHPSLPPIKKQKTTSGDLQIAGVHDLLTRIAKCCKPIPGDTIVGFITQGKGVSIHRQNCKNISHVAPAQYNRIIQVSWDQNQAGSYYIDLQIRGTGSEHLLKEITSVLTHSKVDLVNLHSAIDKKNNSTLIMLTIQIHDLSQLKQLLVQIDQLPDVIEVRRIHS